MQNEFGLVAKAGEHPTSYTMRIMRAAAMREVIEELKKLPLSEKASRNITDVIEQLIQKGNN